MMRSSPVAAASKIARSRGPCCRYTSTAARGQKAIVALVQALLALVFGPISVCAPFVWLLLYLVALSAGGAAISASSRARAR
jgi:hypothetical protein